MGLQAGMTAPRGEGTRFLQILKNIQRSLFIMKLSPEWPVGHPLLVQGIAHRRHYLGKDHSIYIQK
jgi:hypothetical protein